MFRAQTWSRPFTLVMTTAPYSVYVSTPTSANVVCDEKIRSPQPCVVCIRPSRQITSGIGSSKSTFEHKVVTTHGVHTALLFAACLCRETEHISPLCCRCMPPTSSRMFGIQQAVSNDPCNLSKSSNMSKSGNNHIVRNNSTCFNTLFQRSF